MRIGSLKIRLLTGKVLVEDLIDRRPPRRRSAVLHRETARGLDRLGGRRWRVKPDITITLGRDDRLADAGREVGAARTTSRASPGTTARPQGQRRITTTMKWLRASRGQFTFEDHETPWSVVCRNLDVDIGNLPKYHGTATFKGGTVHDPELRADVGEHEGVVRHRRAAHPSRPDRSGHRRREDRGARRGRRRRTGRSRATRCSRACTFRACASCSSRTSRGR